MSIKHPKQKFDKDLLLIFIFDYNWGHCPIQTQRNMVAAFEFFIRLLLFYSASDLITLYSKFIDLHVYSFQYITFSNVFLPLRRK